MATDDSEAGESGNASDDAVLATTAQVPAGSGGSAVVVGEYTWADFLREHGHAEAVDDVYPEGHDGPVEWAASDVDPTEFLGFHPDDIEQQLARAAGPKAEFVDRRREGGLDYTEVPVTKDVYTWEHFKQEYYYEDGEAPTSDGEIVPFDSAEYLGFDGAEIEGRLADVGNVGEHLADVVDERTVKTFAEFEEDDVVGLNEVDWEDVEGFDEDDFFTDEDGHTTLVNRYDLEKAVPQAKKSHFREIQRYWVNEPYAFIIIFHSIKENEKKYYAVEPYLNEIEQELKEFLEGKLRNAIKYSDDEVVVEGDEDDRKEVIDRETRRLLRRYDLYAGEDSPGLMTQLKGMLGMDVEVETEKSGGWDGIEVRPEPKILADDPDTVTQYQVEKLLYYLKRDFIGYERIDPIKHDTMNVEDISADGYNAPVFVYHSDYEQVITNIYHGKEQLDDFVVKLAQRSGKGISKRRPQVDASLPDGSRSQLTLGEEVSDHGTNYTIRQFKEVPFTPIDQIAWNTMSLEEMAFLWLCIENEKSMLIAGGTATGKTTLLNALSLFIPSNTKIVSIEDTREVELPQRNWVASVTRPSFGEDDTGDVDEFDLLEAALRQRPDYIVMGEVRGEEGRDLFQVMSTGHCSYSTFHADSVGEVLKRFTTDPINVSKTMFTALDLVTIQTRTRVGGHSVVRSKSLTEINHYDAENDEINVQDVYQWQAETDEFLKMGESNTLESIKFDRGWGHEKLQEELFKREVVLAYLIDNDLRTYTEVAATIQAFINDPETILTLIANDKLEARLEDLREMESVLIEVDPEAEELAPRPEAGEETKQLALDTLERAGDSLLDEYRDRELAGLADTVADEPEELPDPASEVVSVPDEEEEIEFTGEVSEDAIDEGSFDVAEDVDAGEAPAEAAGEQPALESAASDEPAATAEAGTEAEPDESTDEAADDEGPEWLFGDDDSDDVFDFAESDDGGADGEGGDAEGADDGGTGLAFGIDDDADDGTADADGDGAVGADSGDAVDADEDGSGLAFGFDDGDDADSDDAGTDDVGAEDDDELAFDDQLALDAGEEAENGADDEFGFDDSDGDGEAADDDPFSFAEADEEETGLALAEDEEPDDRESDSDFAFDDDEDDDQVAGELPGEEGVEESSGDSVEESSGEESLEESSDEGVEESSGEEGVEESSDNGGFAFGEGGDSTDDEGGESADDEGGDGGFAFDEGGGDADDGEAGDGFSFDEDGESADGEEANDEGADDGFAFDDEERGDEE